MTVSSGMVKPRCRPTSGSHTRQPQPFYRRSIAILEKIEAEPGIETGSILGRFTSFEKDDISPPLTPVLLQVLLEALYDMGYVKIHDGRATTTGKEPPSRPEIGKGKDE